MQRPDAWRQAAHIDLTVSSDEEPEQAPHPRASAMLGEDATGSLSKARRPPRIIDTDDEDEDEDVRSRPTAKPGLARKQKARVVLSDSEDGDEVSIDTSRGDSFIDDDDDEGEEPATASDTASNSDSDDESVRGTVSNFRAAPVAPLRSVGNTASSSLFNKSAAAKPDLHSYSFGAQRAPPSSATSSAGLSLKERLFAKVQEQQKRIGVPISVPREGARGSPPAGREGFAIDDDRALNKMMANLDVADDASPQDQEAALKELVASTSDMTSVADFEPPEGLACTLLPHQEIGVRWLVERETGKKRGGILGDDMGLGKTIQLIALMLANPSDRVKTKAKTTLVVCPVALMEQWKAEIAKHTDGRLRVLIHHGPSRTSEGRKLAKYDVVITSYPTLSSEWVDPNPKKAKKGMRAAESDDDLDELGKLGKKGSRLAKEDVGALFDLEHDFYRVILDEAHQIKNRTTKMQKACVALDAYYRWCLTGTPIQNEVMDLFSLFEFLGRRVVNPLHEVSEFKAKIQKPMSGKRTKLALARLGVVLSAIMLRRRKTDFVDGKPLLALPPREVVEVKGPFLDPREAEFYEKIEEKMRQAMDKFKTADIMRNYTQVLVKLLRMRQACNHPGLVLKGATDMDALELKPDTPASVSAPSSSGSNDDNLSSMLGSMSLAPAVERAGPSCAICSKPVGKTRADAGESVCSACEGDMRVFAGMQSSTKVRRTLEILDQVRCESAEAARKAAASDSEGDEDEDEVKVGIEGKGKAPRHGPLGPKKTIIFSQFTSMFDILEPFLDKAGYRYVRYDGSMNTRERDEALHTIRTSDRHTVILVSLKCGAVGLNLTVCSRVILLDLWWNPAIEQQAFDRAHRYGQKDHVKIYKLVIDGTVEDRILTLQQQKSDLAKAALDGKGDFAKAQKLSVQDILYLFRGDGDRTRGRTGPVADLEVFDD
ncbi:DNA repair protein rad5 [Rhodotorula diobovata]|uniref:DNA repair protein rad5 n=1 Tax=Rhodotorula diobovata TaxID=5288 RepID=A0A5C5FXD6_9BASI|nr:DNA repair protein rad5 [Rhodotorula diobovata]